MNPNKQKMAIAEACPAIFEINNGRYKLPFFIRYRASGHECDPLNDLNAMHEAEKMLTADQWYEYDQLMPLRDPQKMHATAAQKAEAFLRAISKWEDDT